VSSSTDARTSALSWRPLSTKSRILGAAGAAALVVVAFSGYAVGLKHEQRTNVLTGDFYVGAQQATGDVDGWVYGIVDSVSWVDPEGSFHQSGWPTCLDTVGTTVRAPSGKCPQPDPRGARGGRWCGWIAGAPSVADPPGNSRIIARATSITG